MLSFDARTTLPGSEAIPPTQAQPVGPVQSSERVSVTVFLRRKGPEPPIPVNGSQTFPSREQFGQEYGANKADIQLIEQFAHAYHLTVVDASAPKRRVILSATAAAMEKAFQANFICYKSDLTGDLFRARTGSVSIPVELKDAVVAVLGLDNRPIARAHFRTISEQAAAAQPATYTPPQVAALYNYPTGLTGSGHTVAIIELGGGYNTSDLNKYFSGLNLPSQPTVTAVSVDGGTNSPGSSADAEVMLDIEVIGSIAYGANIAVYFAPNTDQGFVDAVADAAHDATRKPSVISISWGGPEDSWSQQSQTAMNSALQDAAALGVTVAASSGDNGSDDGVGDGALHTDFPACSPYALACGGTALEGSGTTISSEVVWNESANNEGATGGGVSKVFPLPSYQSSAGVPANPNTGFAGRGTPDVAGNADPVTGYQILVNGQSEIVGGTSAVSPLWAALVALINQQRGTPVGFLNPKIYPLGGSGFRDITSGNNDDAGLGYYSAGPGWDPCTGLGSPNGAALLNALQSASGAGSGGS